MNKGVLHNIYIWKQNCICLAFITIQFMWVICCTEIKKKKKQQNVLDILFNEFKNSYIINTKMD